MQEVDILCVVESVQLAVLEFLGTQKWTSFIIPSQRSSSSQNSNMKLKLGLADKNERKFDLV